MAMIRCFSDILCDQRIPDTIRQSVYLQTVTLDTVYSVAGDCRGAGLVTRSRHLLKHLLASLSDDRGEMVRTTVINVNIPNRTRRKRASARRVGLKRLFDWVLSIMSLSLVPWRLVIGRLGRIGHGERRGWSTLLTRKSLKKAVKQLRTSVPG